MDAYWLKGMVAHTGNFPTLGELELRSIYTVEPFYHACQLTSVTHSLVTRRRIKVCTEAN